MGNAPPVSSMPDFPNQLGPFMVVKTEFSGEEFQLIPGMFGQPAEFPLMGEDGSGINWQMEKMAAEKDGIVRIGERTHVQGRFSPRYQVTLSGRPRRAAKIPQDARTFVWSYPVDCWKDITGDSSAAASFLGLGGFVYMDNSYKIVAATTLMAPRQGMQASLFFNEPQPWRPEWTMALAQQERIQPTTIEALGSAGARHFCWLRPHEHFQFADTQPFVPHGGFVYLFHEDRGQSHQLDRYFSLILSGDFYDAQGVSVLCNLEDHNCAPRAAAFKRGSVDQDAPAPMAAAPAIGIHHSEEVDHNNVIIEHPRG